MCSAAAMPKRKASQWQHVSVASEYRWEITSPLKDNRGKSIKVSHERASGTAAAVAACPGNGKYLDRTQTEAAASPATLHRFLRSAIPPLLPCTGKLSHQFPLSWALPFLLQI